MNLAYAIMITSWTRGVAWLTRLPVKEEIAGSNPVESATSSLVAAQPMVSRNSIPVAIGPAHC